MIRVKNENTNTVERGAGQEPLLCVANSKRRREETPDASKPARYDSVDVRGRFATRPRSAFFETATVKQRGSAQANAPPAYALACDLATGSLADVAERYAPTPDAKRAVAKRRRLNTRPF